MDGKKQPKPKKGKYKKNKDDRKNKIVLASTDYINGMENDNDRCQLEDIDSQ
jgi:hypothetical protein